MGVTTHSQGSDLHAEIGVMDTGKLGCAGGIPAFSRKRILLEELEFPSSINILPVKAEKAQTLQEEGVFLEHSQRSCRDLGFFVSKTTLFLLKIGKGSTPEGFAAGC